MSTKTNRRTSQRTKHHPTRDERDRQTITFRPHLRAWLKEMSQLHDRKVTYLANVCVNYVRHLYETDPTFDLFSRPAHLDPDAPERSQRNPA
jgi:hypothetical protein